MHDGSLTELLNLQPDHAPLARSILGSQFSCKCVYLDVERQLSAMVVVCRWWCTLRTGYLDEV